MTTTIYVCVRNLYTHSLDYSKYSLVSFELVVSSLSPRGFFLNRDSNLVWQKVRSSVFPSLTVYLKKYFAIRLGKEENQNKRGISQPSKICLRCSSTRRKNREMKNYGRRVYGKK